MLGSIDWAIEPVRVPMQAEVSTFPDIHRASKKTPKNQWPDIEEESGLVHRASVRHPSVAMVLQAAVPASQQQEVPP